MSRLTLWIAAVAACTFSSAALAVPPTTVPEPGSFGLLAVGLAAIAAARLRRK